MNNYNGYSNRETWAVSLWLNNDEGLYNWVKESSQNINPESYGSMSKFEDFLCNEVFNPSYWRAELGGMNEIVTTMFEDIGSLYRVNWNEVALTILE